VAAAGVALWVARSLLSSIGHANTTASRLAVGDLSVDVRRHSADEMGDLLEALANRSISFRDALRVVHASSNSIHTASGEVSSGNNDLSIRTEQQSSNLQQTAAAMEQLTSAVQSAPPTRVRRTRSPEPRRMWRSAAARPYRTS